VADDNHGHDGVWGAARKLGLCCGLRFRCGINAVAGTIWRQFLTAQSQAINRL
jgi:hypothetical protein